MNLRFPIPSALVLALLAAAPAFAEKPAHMGPQKDGPFRKVVLEADQEVDGKLEDTLKDPMELSIAADGRVFYVQRDGAVKVWMPAAKTSQLAGKLDVFTGLEDGLLGVTLDPKFTQNGWIYFFYAAPETTNDSQGKKTGENRVSRFTVQDNILDPTSEKILLRIATQREQCCHSGGSLGFDAQGNLYASVGDNTNPFESDGFAPIDDRPGRSPWDASKSSGNPNDLRGKILRIHPEPDGTTTIPEGNLFPVGTPGARPEIYVMGNRNPFRISIDQKTGFLYWGEVGPDAGSPNPKRGPAGFDELNQARQAGNFGWPFFVADNKPYREYDFDAKTYGDLFNALNPRNISRYNTGLQELPPAQPALIFYPSGPSTRFPVLGSGGRTAMAGPVYYFDPGLVSSAKLPAEFDSTLFFYEWSRNWIMAVKLKADGKVEKIAPFLKGMTFKRPMDIELGPDGCLYVIEYGTNWANNTDSQIVRIEYAPEIAAGNQP